MRLFATTLIATLTLAACSSDSTTTPTCTATAITISGAPASLNTGGSATLTANVTATNCSGASVVWSSSNSAVLSVDQTGKITAVSVGGPVTITAAEGGQSATAQVSVLAVPVAAVTVSPDSIIVGVGSTFQLSSISKAADSSVLAGRTTVWSGGTAGIATISASGLVTAVAPGSSTATATTETKVGTGKIFVATPRFVQFWSGTVTPVGTVPPNPIYDYNLNGGTDSYSLISTGSYTLSYTGFARSGAETEILFTTAYTPIAGGFCTIGSWENTSASVNCVNAAGDLTNSEFDFMAVGSGTFAGRFGYAWSVAASPPAAAPATSGYSFSSSNQAITITKTGTGAYTVLFAGLGRTISTDHEAPMVSGYGNPAVECHLSGWSTIGADLSVNVVCFTAAGAASDNQFDVMVVSKPRTGANLVIADADQPSVTTAYTPVNSSIAAGAGAVSITRTGVGVYTMSVPGFVRTGSLVETYQITAVNSAAVRCVSAGWNFTAQTTNVSCFTAAGAPVDSRFVLLGLQ